jgi:hypothetical protein
MHHEIKRPLIAEDQRPAVQRPGDIPHHYRPQANRRDRFAGNL